MTDAEQLTCRELVEFVTDYLEDALAPADRRRFEEHLAGCDGCARYLDQLRQTIRIVGTVTIDDLSPEAEDALLNAFRDWRNAS